MPKSSILRQTEIGSIIDPADPPLSEIFHENTKLHEVSLPNAEWVATQFSFDDIAAMLGARKVFPYRRSIALDLRHDADGPVADPSFQSVVRARRTVRRFGPAPLSFAALSGVLDLSYGVTGESVYPGGLVGRHRAAPSAGALYPAEIYLYARNVDGLAAGLYHYAPEQRALAEIDAGDHLAAVWRACCEQDYAQQAAVTIFITGVFARTKSKYGERGYRYVLLDIGHLGENLCLAATAADLAITTTCAFYDDAVNRLLGVDGLDEAAAYVAFLGPKADDETEGARTD